MMQCQHPPEKLSDGPRIPMRWGSGPTQVCKCGAWRITLHTNGPWRKEPMNLEPDPEI